MKGLILFSLLLATNLHRCDAFGGVLRHESVRSLRKEKIHRRWNGDSLKNKIKREWSLGVKPVVKPLFRRSKALLLKRATATRTLLAAILPLLFVLLSTPNPAVASTYSTTTVVAAAGPKIITPQLSLVTQLRLVVRLVFAALTGSIVGWERSTSKHSAGVRTMALVSLGAAAFTICSAYGFQTGDPTRMAANVASGVGFLGAGVITTQAAVSKRNNKNYNIVHGLTTAAAIWLSAALGVASGVGLYAVSACTALTTVAILRGGKKSHSMPESLGDTKNAAKYHPSDTMDTEDWDENDYSEVNNDAEEPVAAEASAGVAELYQPVPSVKPIKVTNSKNKKKKKKTIKTLDLTSKDWAPLQFQNETTTLSRIVLEEATAGRNLTAAGDSRP